MSTLALRASLRLWRWRLHRHHDKLRAARKRHNTDEVARLAKLIKHDEYVVHRRIKQLAAREIPRGDWMPEARKLERDGTPWQVECAPKGVLHTTEGPGDATATLDAKRAWPHFQVETDGRITQYLPMGTGGRALAHTSWPPTNGAHAYQIEVCGYAAHPKWPAVQVDAVRRVMRFIEKNGGVAREANVSFLAPQRLTGKAWIALRGWCGHVHVPENDHTDPGRINIKELL